MSTPRPELLELLAHAKENPDADTPRLILADWLEERGGASDRSRAELVRLQCRRARLSFDDPLHDELEAREGKLCDAHWLQWWPAFDSARLALRRGCFQCEIQSYATFLKAE